MCDLRPESKPNLLTYLKNNFNMQRINICTRGALCISDGIRGLPSLLPRLVVCELKQRSSWLFFNLPTATNFSTSLFMVCLDWSFLLSLLTNCDCLFLYISQMLLFKLYQVSWFGNRLKPMYVSAFVSAFSTYIDELFTDSVDISVPYKQFCRLGI